MQAKASCINVEKPCVCACVFVTDVCILFNDDCETACIIETV